MSKCCIDGIIYITCHVTGFFHSAQFSRDSSLVVLLHLLIVCSFLLLRSSVPWYGCTTNCLLFTHGRSSGLFPVLAYYAINIRVQVFVWLCFHFSGINAQVLGHMAVACFVFRKLPTIFQSGCALFTFPSAVAECLSLLGLLYKLQARWCEQQVHFHYFGGLESETKVLAGSLVRSFPSAVLVSPLLLRTLVLLGQGFNFIYLPKCPLSRYSRIGGG